MSTNGNEKNTHIPIIAKNELGWIENLKPMGSSSEIYRPEFDETNSVFGIVRDTCSMAENQSELGG